MNINYISDAELPSTSANSVQIISMCNAFIKNGHSVTLYSKAGVETALTIKEQYGSLDELKIKVLPFKKIKLFGNIIYAYQLSKRVRKSKNIDLIFGRYAYGLYLIKHMNFPIAYEAHLLPQRKIHKYMERTIFKSNNFTKLVVISENLKKDYLREFPCLSSDDIMVAHDGADVSPEVDNISTIDSNIRKNCVGYVGSLHPGKGMEIIIALALRLSSYTFHVVGGKNKDLQYWKSKTSDFENIIFHGFVPNQHLQKYYKMFDIAIAPYNADVKSRSGQSIGNWMSPLKLFEYMKYKKAIVASNLSTIREIITDSENGLLCSPDNIDEWINAIELLNNSKETKKKLSNQGFRDLKEKYSWERRAKEIINAIKK